MFASHRLRRVPLLAVVAVLALSFAGQASAGGAALRWKGQVDTDLSFSEFFASSNTIMGRFMVQYPRAYRGPIFGVKAPNCSVVCPPSGPSFELGMGSYGEGAASGVKLVLEIAGTARYFTVPIPAGVWQHVALQRTNGTTSSIFALYLNGVHVCADAPGTCDLWFFNGLSSVPSGTLALGRTSKATTGNSVGLHQFYGLIDDVAVYTTWLSSAQIKSYASLNHVLSGGEAGLLAGYTFEASPAKAKLTRPATYTGSAYSNPLVGATANANSSKLDAKMLPVADTPYVVRLPFAAGEPWQVIQPYGGDGSGDSHVGAGAFSLDMVRLGFIKTKGAPVFTPVTGVVIAVDDSHDELGFGACPKQVGGKTKFVNCNYVQILAKGTPGLVLSFRHLAKDSVPFEVGDAVQAGQWIANVGDHTNGAHLHFGARINVKGGVTIPLLFKNYQQLNLGGWWDTVNFGVPTDKMVVVAK
jgi:murein DD-endopeptidase MepM/ murein hydrolase activator NlpD